MFRLVQFSKVKWKHFNYSFEIVGTIPTSPSLKSETFVKKEGNEHSKYTKY